MNKQVVGIDISKGWFDGSWEGDGRERCQRFSRDVDGFAQLLAGTGGECVCDGSDGSVLPGVGELSAWAGTAGGGGESAGGAALWANEVITGKDGRGGCAFDC